MTHRRFIVRDTPDVWADALSEYVFPGFNVVRGRLCGASLGDCDILEVSGPVRQAVTVVEPRPEVVKRVRRRLRQQGVVL